MESCMIFLEGWGFSVNLEACHDGLELKIQTK